MMSLSLDEVIMLAGADRKNSVKKSDILYNATAILPKQHSYFTLSLGLDSLVKRGLIEVTKDWQYRLTEEGYKELKINYQKLQVLMLQLHNGVNG